MRTIRLIAEIDRAESLASIDPAESLPVVPLAPGEVNHVTNVLRLKAGDPVILVDRESGIQFHGKLTDNASVQLESALENFENRPRITAIIGYPKHAVADTAVEKLTELGIERIIFFNADRTQGQAGDRTDRWQRIADAATKQSGARAAPKIETYTGIKPALKALENTDQIAICKLACMAPQDRAEGSSAGVATLRKTEAFPILSLFEDNSPLQLQKSLQTDEIYVLVGPEGGLSRDEIELLVGENFLPVTLGRRTLRTETALIVVFGIFAAWRSELLSSS